MSQNKKVLKVLSLGWGVQSFTLATMCALGFIEKPDMVIHSEIPYESSKTKEFKNRYSSWLKENGITVINVTPRAKILTEWGTNIPAYSDYNKGGQLLRACTNLWKIAPIKRIIREELKKRKMKLLPEVVELWLGITTDEAKRAKPYSVKYIKSKYPLLDLGMSRQDCIKYLKQQGIDVPPKSSCVFCPYRSEDGWREIKKDKRDWELAIEIDNMIRNVKKDCKLYLHYTLQPIEKVNFYKNMKGEQ